jgi:hydroxypyruvate isomerase
MKASVCIEMLFKDLPFLERIRKAAEVGYDAIEFWNWENKDLVAIKKVTEQVGIDILIFQANKSGSLVNPEHRKAFIKGVQESLAKAKEIGVKQLFLLTDELGTDRSVLSQFPNLNPEHKYQSVVDGLKVLVKMAEEAGVTLNLEVLNSKVDHKGYWLDHIDVGFELIRKLAHPNLRILFDCYHVQIMDGNLIPRITENIDLIGHIHVADTPGRHEPGTGEINFANIYKALRRVGYTRYVGMEFEPTGDSTTIAKNALLMLKS